MDADFTAFTNVCHRTSYTVTKVWEGIPDNFTLPEIHIQLMQDDYPYGNPVRYGDGALITLNGSETTSWTYTWTDLPAAVYHSDGTSHPYRYSAREVGTPRDFQYHYDAANDRLVNVYRPGVFVAYKYWAVGDLGVPVQLELWQVNVADQTQRTSLGTVSLDGVAETTPEATDAGEYMLWAYRWVGLPANNGGEGGVDISYKYVVTEVPLAGYVIDATSSASTYIRNVRDTVDIPFTKAWAGGPTPYPAIELQLTQDGVPYGDKVTLPSGTLTYTWTGLPRYKTWLPNDPANSVLHEYRIVETPIPGYSPDWSAGPNAVTNRYLFPLPELSLRAHKAFEGGILLGDDFSFELIDDAGHVLQTKTNNAFGSVFFDPLPFTSVGQFEYLIREVKGTALDTIYGPAVYRLFIDVTRGEDNRLSARISTMFKDDTPVDIGALPVFTNTLEKTQYTATKIWEGNDPARPASVSVQLLQDGVPYGEAVDVSGSGTLWTHTFTDLPKSGLDAEGKVFLHRYSAREAVVPTHYYYEVDENGSLVNSYRPGDFTAQKNWIGGAGVKTTLSLYRLHRDDPAAPAVWIADVEVDGVVNVNPDGSGEIAPWVYRWQNLIAYDNGVNFKYEIREKTVPPGYAVDLVSSASTHVDNVAMTTSRTVHKNWYGAPAQKPDVRFQLLRDGVPYGPVVILSGGQTSYTWSGLEKYRLWNPAVDSPEQRVEYVYTVTELRDPNYDQYWERDGWVVLNIRVPRAPGQYTPRAHKTLDGLAPAAGAFSFELLGPDGSVLQTVSKGLYGAVEFLPLQFQAPGDYAFTLREKAGTDPNITYDTAVYRLVIRAAYDQNNVLQAELISREKNGAAIPLGQLMLFENKHKQTPTATPVVTATPTPTTTPTPTVTATPTPVPVPTPPTIEMTTERTLRKSWEGAPAVKPDVRFQLLRDGEPYGPIQILRDGQTSYTWTNLDKYRVWDEQTDPSQWVAYVYTVTELKDPGYDQQWDSGGWAVTNIAVPQLPGQFTLRAHKTLDGLAPAAGAFSFELLGADGGVMQTVSNVRYGAVEFLPLQFQAPGDYEFTLREKPGADPGITYAATVYRVVIRVTLGQNNTLQTEMIQREKDGAAIPLGELKLFENSRKVVPTPTPTLTPGETPTPTPTLTPGETPTPTPIPGPTGSPVPVPAPTPPPGPTDTPAPVATPTPPPGPTDTPAPVTTATPTPRPTTPTPRPTTPPQPGYDPINVPLSALKELRGRALKAGEFSFTLKDAAGNTLQIVSNAADGSVTFKDRRFSRTGVFLYTIDEVKGTQSAISYDATRYTARVEVSASGGRLQASLSYLKDGTPYGGAPTFTNAVKPPQTGDSSLRTAGLIALAALTLGGAALTIRQSKRRRRSG